MSNDDSRGNESSDRRDASNADQTIRTYLEALDTLTRELHAHLEDPTNDEPIPDRKRKNARRRCRKIRTETCQLGLLLIGPEATIPTRPTDEPNTPAGVTTHSEPTPTDVTREHHRTRRDDGGPQDD